MKARDTKKYRHICLLKEQKINKMLKAITFKGLEKKMKKLLTFT